MKREEETVALFKVLSPYLPSGVKVKVKMKASRGSTGIEVKVF
jgi:hypothetical protein